MATTMYKNQRNGKVATLISQDSKTGNVMLEFPDGKTIDQSPSTFKRWWKAIADDQQDAQAAEPVQETVKPAKKEKVDKPAKKEAPKAKGKKATPVDDVNEEVEAIEEYITDKVKELGGELFFPKKAPNVILFKVDGHMFARLNRSRKQMTLCTRKAATLKVKQPDKDIKHLFDAGYLFATDTKANHTLIDKLLKESLKYQVDRKAGTKKAKSKKGDK